MVEAKPKVGDLVLFQIEGDVWTAALCPMFAQKFYADDYDVVKQKALEYVAYWSGRGRIVSVWKEIDANKNEYFREL